MNVTAVYVADDESAMPQFFDPRVSVEYGGKGNRYEWPTLRKLVAYCREQPTARVIYFHSKGASRSLNHYSGWYCYNWRRLMEHFTIDLHRSILLNELSDTSPYQVAGIHKKQEHFSGNFWLAKCSWINRRKEIGMAPFGEDNRFLAEKWVGLPNWEEFQEVAVSCWEPSEHQCQNLYDCYIPEYEYVSIDRCGGNLTHKTLQISYGVDL
jgi:hypothetical protein